MPILDDVLEYGLEVVFCGTAAGFEAARRQAYYAGPGNRFWATLHAVGFTDRLLAPEEFRTVLAYGLGLTDLVKNVAGNDRNLRPSDFDVAQLKKEILKYQPRFLAFVGKRAATEFLGRKVEYGLQPKEDMVNATSLFVLPAPGGAARRYWNEGPWRELARARSCKLK